MSRLNKFKLLIGVVAIIVSIGVPIIYSYLKKYNTLDTATSKQSEVDSSSKESTTKWKDYDVDKSAVLSMLEQQGVDTSKLKEGSRTESGADILGDALPLKDYRTLADAEKDFGNYLGFHNQLESVPEYQLVKVVIVDKRFMQAIFNNKDDTKSIIVKISCTQTPEELIKVYDKYGYNDTIEFTGITVYMQGENKDKINTVYLSTKGIDGKVKKSYSIHTATGLNNEQAKAIAGELVNNLKLMEDIK